MLKTTLTALTLLLMPGLAIAQCSGHSAQQTAMSCAEGFVMDPDTQTCVEQVTG